MTPYVIAGAETQTVPLVLDSPHSGTMYPADFRHIADMARLRMAEDTHLHDLWRGAVQVGAVLLHALFPRSYIDANRAADDFNPGDLADDFGAPLCPSVKSELGIGLAWTRVPPDGEPMYNTPLTAAELRYRIAQYHQPYHTVLKDLLDRSHARFGTVYHVNCHSMAHYASAMSTQSKGTERPDFVLGDRDGTCCDPDFTETVREFLLALGYEVAVNDPYKGVELVRAWSNPAKQYHSLQIEVDRLLYMDEATRDPNDGYARIQETFAALAAHLADYASLQARRDT